MLEQRPARLDQREFFTYSMRNVVGDGRRHLPRASSARCSITLAAAVISVPIGLLTAIYLVEYGKRPRWRAAITFLVDVMTGIPSIVAGLFAYALFVLFFGPAFRLGLGGSVALSLLMIPVVVRSSRGDAQARARTSCARRRTRSACRSGARSSRSCCRPRSPASSPASCSRSPASSARPRRCWSSPASPTRTNFNLFDGRMTTLPVFIYYQLTQPGVPPEFGDRPRLGRRRSS